VAQADASPVHLRILQRGIAVRQGLRFLRHALATVLRRDVAFANGVVLAPDESYLLVAETIGYRILKFWLRGPRAGEWFDFVTGTRGFPDNISLSDSDWCGCRCPRHAGFHAPPAPDPAAVGAPGSAAAAPSGRGSRVGASLRPRREAGPRHQDTLRQCPLGAKSRMSPGKQPAESLHRMKPKGWHEGEIFMIGRQDLLVTSGLVVQHPAFAG